MIFFSHKVFCLSYSYVYVYIYVCTADGSAIIATLGDSSQGPGVYYPTQYMGATTLDAE